MRRLAYGGEVVAATPSCRRRSVDNVIQQSQALSTLPNGKRIQKQQFLQQFEKLVLNQKGCALLPGKNKVRPQVVLWALQASSVSCL